MRVIGAAYPVWVSLDVLAAHGVPLACFPLYRSAGCVRSGLMHVSSARAQAAGLTLTPPGVTAHGRPLDPAQLAASGTNRTRNWCARS